MDVDGTLENTFYGIGNGPSRASVLSLRKALQPAPPTDSGARTAAAPRILNKAKSMKRKSIYLLLALALSLGLTSCIGYADIYEDYPPGYYEHGPRHKHKRPKRHHRKPKPQRPAPHPGRPVPPPPAPHR